MKKRVLPFILATTTALSMMPIQSFAKNEVTEEKNNASYSAVSSSDSYVEGQVIVLYENDAVNTEESSGKKADTAKGFGSTMKNTAAKGQKSQIKKELNNTLPDQKKILEKSIGKSYEIDDTIIFDDNNESNETIVSVIESDQYTTDEMVSLLSKNKDVKAVEPNYICKALSTDISDLNDEYIDKAYYLEGDNSINVTDVWDLYDKDTSSSDEVVVAVIDTGVDYEHEELSSKMWVNNTDSSLLAGKYGYDFAYKDDDPMDENGHGTHCAGIIAAQMNDVGIAGVASIADNVKIMALRFLDESGSGYVSDALGAYYYIKRAIDAGVNVRAINNSWGGSGNDTILEDIIDLVGQQGALSLMAAGNDSSDNDVYPTTPATYNSDYIVAVASTNENGELSSYSNYGEETVELGAPGTNIISSVSYYNYMPWAYDSTKIKKNTYKYGEFNTSMSSNISLSNGVAPSTGGQSSSMQFGNSVVKSTDASADMSLSIDSENSVRDDDNAASLKWTIDAKAGQTYSLLFPYDKESGTTDYNINTNISFKAQVDEAAAYISYGDFVVNDSGMVAEEWTEYSMAAKDYNDIWHTSGDNTYCASSEEFARWSSVGYTTGIGLYLEVVNSGPITIYIDSVAVSKKFEGQDTDADGTDDIQQSFGKYAMYSGTSMATPVVTGSVALLTAIDTSADALTIKSRLLGAVNDEKELKTVTSGRLDFSKLDYTGGTIKYKPSMSSVEVNTNDNTLTITGDGFGETIGKLEYKRPYQDDSKKEISSSSIKNWTDDTIVIKNASSLIGSYVNLFITNTYGYTSHFKRFLVKGMAKYEDYALLGVPNTESGGDYDYSSTLDDDWWFIFDDEEVIEKHIISAGDTLAQYDDCGEIYIYFDDYADFVQVTPIESNLSSFSNYTDWNLNDYQSGDISIENIYGAAYYNGKIYEWLKIQAGDLSIYTLMAYEMETDTWAIIYDGYGKKVSELPVDTGNFTGGRMAISKGYIYWMGGTCESTDSDGNIVEDVSDSLYVGKISEASSFTKAKCKKASMPKAQYNGYAVCCGADLYYLMGYDDSYLNGGVFNNVIYKYLRSSNKWETMSYTLPTMVKNAVFASSYGSASVGTYGGGIVIAGVPFDGYGDSIYVDINSKSIKPMNRTILSGNIDKPISGTVVGKYVYAVYTVVDKDYNEYQKVTRAPISSSAVSIITTKKVGKGAVTITGAYAYNKSDTVKIKIKVNNKKKFYLKSIAITGKKTKTFKAKKHKWKYTLTFKATKDNYKLKIKTGKYAKNKKNKKKNKKK